MKKLGCNTEYIAVSIAGNYPGLHPNFSRPPPRRQDRCACLKHPARKCIGETCTVLCILLIVLRLGFYFSFGDYWP